MGSDDGLSRRRLEALLVAIGSVVFAAIASEPLRGHYGEIDTVADWDFWFGLQWVAYRTILHFHQLPLWNPYKCGGMPLLGNPQSHIVTPWFALTLVLGPFTGLHGEIPIHLAVAWAGTYVLARVAGARPLGAVGAAMSFGASSWFYLRMGAGELIAFGFTYAPWILAGVLMATREHSDSPRPLQSSLYSIGAGLALALAFLEAGPYPAILEILLLGSILMPLAILNRSRWPLIAAMETGVWALGFCAVKLIPAWMVIQQHPRLTSETEMNGPDVLWTALFAPIQHTFSGSSNGWGFWEVGAYIGFFAIPAALVLMRPRGAWHWIIACAIVSGLSLGDVVWWGPWPLLHHLPLFASMRLPSRLLILLVLIVAVLAALGLDWLASLRRPLGTFAAIALLVACSLRSMTVGPPILSDVINNQVAAAPARPEFTQMGPGRPENSMLLSAMQNEGAVECYEYTTWSTPVTSFGSAGYRGEYHLEGAGTVRSVRWTPNRLDYDVDTPAPGVLVINQNYDSSWRIRSGQGEVFSHDGLLAVALRAGHQQISLQYLGAPFLAGAAITLLSAMAAPLIAANRIRTAKAKLQ